MPGSWTITKENKKPYYIRHKFCYGDDPIRTRNELIEKDLIAIHYEDKRSWNPRKYIEGARQPIEYFNRMNKEGGWVIADYRPIDTDVKTDSSNERIILIGKIERGSKHFFRVKVKCSRHREPDHKGTHFPHHLYKVLSIRSPRQFSKDDYPILRLPFGQSTVCQTNQIGLDKLKLIYKKKRFRRKVDSLHPSELETLCHEYLRRFGKPRLEFLLSPVGRQMEDFDIVGKATDGTIIQAQVTAQRNANEANMKLRSLKRERNKKGLHLVYFGDTKPTEDFSGIRFVHIKDVFVTMDRNERTKQLIDEFLNYHPGTQNR